MTSGRCEFDALPKLNATYFCEAGSIKHCLGSGTLFDHFPWWDMGFDIPSPDATSRAITTSGVKVAQHLEGLGA